MIAAKIYSGKSPYAAPQYQLLIHITIDDNHIIVINPKVWCWAALATTWLLVGALRETWYACATHTNKTGTERPCINPI